MKRRESRESGDSAGADTFLQVSQNTTPVSIWKHVLEYPGQKLRL